MESIGKYLRRCREVRGMSVSELSRATRIPASALSRIESDQFDDLPGEVFVRGFLKAYAKAVGIQTDDVLARYTSSRRVAWATPLPFNTTIERPQTRRFGVAIAFVLLLILFTLAVSIVLKPRGRDLPNELSWRHQDVPQQLHAVGIDVFGADHDGAFARPRACRKG